MALRTIRVLGDEILAKKSKEVTEITPKIRELIDDMFDTLYDADGVGLAAVQVGVLKRIIVIDIGEEEGGTPIVLINPKLVDKSGEQSGNEGCLSVPGKTGVVTRPNYVKVVYLDENLEPQEIEGTELLARALCHELDHLEGEVYVDKVEGDLMDVKDSDKNK